MENEIIFRVGVEHAKKNKNKVKWNDMRDGPIAP